jgi:molybdopterin converting factor small subunit
MRRTKILIPGPLLSYTKQRQVDAAGATLGTLLEDLDRQYPGIRFRMVDEQEHVRPHLRPDDSVHIVQALSGG